MPRKKKNSNSKSRRTGRKGYQFTVAQIEYVKTHYYKSLEELAADTGLSRYLLKKLFNELNITEDVIEDARQYMKNEKQEEKQPRDNYVVHKGAVALTHAEAAKYDSLQKKNYLKHIVENRNGANIWIIHPEKKDEAQ